MVAKRKKTLSDLIKSVPTGNSRKTWIDKLPASLQAELVQMRADYHAMPTSEQPPINRIYQAVKEARGIPCSEGIFREWMKE